MTIYAGPYGITATGSIWLHGGPWGIADQTGIGSTAPSSTPPSSGGGGGGISGDESRTFPASAFRTYPIHALREFP